MTEVGVGLIGLGTVGSAVARRLIDEWELLTRRAGATPVLRRVAVRDPSGLVTSHFDGWSSTPTPRRSSTTPRWRSSSR